MAKIIKINNNVSDLKDCSLEKAVGGYIEVLSLEIEYEGAFYSYMIVNEEGLLQKLPKNVKATEIGRNSGLPQRYLGDRGIVGNVVLCTKKELY